MTDRTVFLWFCSVGVAIVGWFVGEPNLLAGGASVALVAAMIEDE